jgi:hypothetical protein
LVVIEYRLGVEQQSRLMRRSAKAEFDAAGQFVMTLA